MGYKLEDGVHGAKKVYKQMFKESEINFIWFLGERFNVWFVNDQVGKGDDGGLLSNQPGSCPDKSNSWKVYDDVALKWIKAEEGFNVECVEDPAPFWTEWSQWSTCQPSCRKTENDPIVKRTRTRTCKNESEWSKCEGEQEENDESDACASVCEWDAWSQFDNDRKCYFCNVDNANAERSRTCYFPGSSWADRHEVRGDMCEGAATETTGCDNSCAPSENQCCDHYKISGSNVEAIDGEYFRLHPQHAFFSQTAPVFAKADEQNLIYYVESYNLWVMNGDIDAKYVRAFAKNSGDAKKCPGDFSEW